MSFRLAGYYLWPFGKFIILEHSDGSTSTFGEGTSLLSDGKIESGAGGGGGGDEEPINGESSDGEEQRKCSCGRVLWLLIGGTLCLWAHVMAFIVCWMLVITIPMAKVLCLSAMS